MWEYKLLEAMESVFGLVLILILVLVVVAVTLLKLRNVIKGSTSRFDTIISAIFISELSLRLFCFVRVNQSIVNFFKNIFNVNDTLVVLFDIIMIGLGDNQNVASYARILR